MDALFSVNKMEIDQEVTKFQKELDTLREKYERKVLISQKSRFENDSHHLG